MPASRTIPVRHTRRITMSRISIPTLDAAPEGSRATLDAVHKQLGVVPNLFRLIGNSPTALTAYTGFQSALSKTLDVKTRERIALAVAQVNGCDYCLSAQYLSRWHAEWFGRGGHGTQSRRPFHRSQG